MGVGILETLAGLSLSQGPFPMFRVWSVLSPGHLGVRGPANASTKNDQESTPAPRGSSTTAKDLQLRHLTEDVEELAIRHT